MEKLLDAYQEGLLELNELRNRLPSLRKASEALQAELRSLEAISPDGHLKIPHPGQVCMPLAKELFESTETWLEDPYFSFFHPEDFRLSSVNLRDASFKR